MGQTSQFHGKSPQTPCHVCKWVAVALSLLVAAGFPAQAQQGGSLADAARQARARKQAEPRADTNRAQQVADQLAEDQDDGNAPSGFKTYNAGAYRLWAPGPYTIDAHEDGGTVLAGPRVGTTLPLVLVGNPIVLPWGNNDDAFRDAATQFSRGYAPSAHCTKIALANRSAYQCSLAGANLQGRPISGSATFILDSSHIFPVFCVAATDSRARDILNEPHSSYRSKMNARQVLAQEEEYARQVWQKCETAFQSIQFKTDPAPQEGVALTKAGVEAGRPDPFKPALTERTSTRSEKTPAPSAGGSESESNSLAEIARGLHQANTPGDTTSALPAKTGAVSTVSVGLKVHSFNYCKGTLDYWDASILVPVDAQLVSSDCRQYVFEMKVQGAPLLLLAGTGSGDSCEGRTANDPSLVSWNELVAPEAARAPGTASTISSQQGKVDGKTSVITTMGFKRGFADWISKRAEVENNGVQIVVGCMAPREQFADGDEICSALIGSLRLP